MYSKTWKSNQCKYLETLAKALILCQLWLKTKMIENYFDESNGKLGVKHKNCLVVPRVLAVQVDAVQDVLDQGVGDNRK